MLGKGKIILEVEEPVGKAEALFYAPGLTPKTGLFVREDEHDILTNLLNHLSKFMNRPVQGETPDSTVDFMIKNYGMVVFTKDNSGRKILYSKNYRNKLPVEFTERIRTFAGGTQPEDTIYWAESVYNDGQEAPAREVIWNQRVSKPPRQTTSKREVQKKWTQPQDLTAEERRWLMGGEPPSQ